VHNCTDGFIFKIARILPQRLVLSEERKREISYHIVLSVSSATNEMRLEVHKKDGAWVQRAVCRREAFTGIPQ
jgi:hypothetical protein